MIANLVLRPEGRRSVGALRVARLKDKSKSMKMRSESLKKESTAGAVSCRKNVGDI
jgi:hypothetical protein